jgi:glycosyltransferase involved in cell wall biosynthesis
MVLSEKARTLYICYFGLREPLVQTQVLPYLRQLGRSGVKVSLLTFEPDLESAWSTSERKNWCDLLENDGIEWHTLGYHKRPSLLATLFDIVAGAYYCGRQVRQHRVNILHARSHMPLAMAMLVKLLTGCKLIFDIRGLMAEEYVDSGIWKEGSLVFRAVKWLEAAGIRRADQIVVLTTRMKDWLIEKRLVNAARIEVIPCCTDFSRYVNDESRSGPDSATERFEVIYSGSVTGLYLLEEMGRFFLSLRRLRPDAFLRILTTSPASEAEARLRLVGLNEKDFWVGAAKPSDVPGYLSRARVGLSFRKPTFSQIAASPTKIPEYLAAGLPVVCNSGVGDIDDLVTSERVGVIVTRFAGDEYLRASRQVEELFTEADLGQRCRNVARKHFDLCEVGGARYRRLYERLLEPAG